MYNLIKLLFLMTLFFSLNVIAIDVVTMPAQRSGFDKKVAHKHEVIERALALTVDEFGPYEFNVLTIGLVKGRALKIIKQGDLFNTIILIANREWNDNTTPIKIPLRLGINSYRLLLINESEQAKFNNIHSMEDLKNLTVGLGTDWSITDTFNAHGFNTVLSSDFEGTFLMLPKRRFNYIPRGMNEVFVELAKRKEKLKGVIVEPNLALELKLTTYIYVSKKHPRIAKRLASGLGKMSKNGDLKAIFNKYYLEDVQRANLKSRRIIKIDNPLFVDKELLKDESLWLSLDEISE